MSMNRVEQLEHLKRAAQVAGLSLPAIALPQDRYVTLKGMRFHYLDWGGSGLPVALFLHGGGLTCHSWDLVCLAFRDRFHCLAPDQRGHGDSDWSDDVDYSYEAHVRDIEAFGDKLGLANFVLVGQSLGGINAMVYGGRHPDMLRALVLVDVGPDLRVESVKPIVDFITMPAELPSVDDFVDRALSFNPRRNAGLLRQSLLHNLRQLPDGRWTWKYDRRYQEQIDLELLAKEQQKLWAAITKITCPALCVRGALSKTFLDEDAEKLASKLPDGSWVKIQDAGHTVQGDNPRGLVAALSEFFEGLQVGA